MILIFATPEEAQELLGLSTRQSEIVRPQTSGPCVHYDERSEHAADADPCTYPYGDGTCPHLDNPEILCPVKDACYAMRDIARMQGVCEAEQDEQDADMTAVAPSQTYKTAAPEFAEPEPEEAPVYTTPARPKGRAPPPGKEWTAEEDAAIRPATTPAESVTLYRSAVLDSGRSDAAIRMRWYRKVRPGLCEARDPLPDFVGDVVPVTQSEDLGQDGRDPDQMVGPEPAAGKGIYGDARALHVDMMDGMMCNRPLSQEPETPRDREQTPHSWLGMRVRVLDPLDLANRTGMVVQYNFDLQEMLVALDNSYDRVWLPPESLLLIGAGRRSP